MEYNYTLSCLSLISIWLFHQPKMMFGGATMEERPYCMVISPTNTAYVSYILLFLYQFKSLIEILRDIRRR